MHHQKDPSTHHSLEARVERLERANKLLATILAALVFPYMATLIAGCALRPGDPPVAASPSQVVTATRFELRDERGRIRGSWGMEGQTQVLRLGATPRTPGVLLAAGPDGSSVSIFTRSSYPQGTWSVKRDGDANLTMLQGPLQGRSGFVNLHAGGEGRLILSEDRSRVELRATPRGAELTMKDASHNRIALGNSLYTGYRWALQFRDEGGKPTHREPPNTPSPQ